MIDVKVIGHLFDLSFISHKIEVQFSCALTLHKSGNFHEALEEYGKVLALKPNHYDATANIGCVLEDLGEIDQALLYLEKAINLEPNNFKAYYNCGYIYKKRKDYVLAIRYYSKTIELSPFLLDAYLGRSACYKELGQFDLALNDLLKARDIHPNDKDIINNLGNIYYSLKDYKKASYYYDFAITNHPYFIYPYHNRGLVYEIEKNYKLAIKNFTKAIELDTRYISAYSQRGWCYAETGQYDEALEDYSKVIGLDANNQWCLTQRAEIYLKKELFKFALDDFRNAVKLRFPTHDPETLVTFIEPDAYKKGVIAYEKLMAAGYLPNIFGKYPKYFVIRPSNSDRIILKITNIHVGKTNKRHLDKTGDRYELRFNADFTAVMDRLDSHYREESEESMANFRNFYPLINKYASSIKFISVSLYLDGQLVAGELGILTNKAYLSLTGFHDKPYAGSAQLILLARELGKKGIVFLDFGPSTSLWDPYKLRLGAKIMTTEEYQKLLRSVHLRSKSKLTKNTEEKD